MGLLALFQDYKLLYLKQKSTTHTSYAFLINLRPIHLQTNAAVYFYYATGKKVVFDNILCGMGYFCSFT